MTDAASPAASQRYFALSVARRRRRDSARYALGVFPQRAGHGKSRLHANPEPNFPTFHSGTSFSNPSNADRTLRLRPRAPLESP